MFKNKQKSKIIEFLNIQQINYQFECGNYSNLNN